MITEHDFAKYDSAAKVSHITDLTVGYNQYVSLIETVDNKKYIVKRCKVKGQVDVSSEVIATTLLKDSNVPVPSVIYYDGEMLIENFISGNPLTEEDPLYLFTSLGKLIRQMHLIKTKGFGLTKTMGEGTFKTEYEQIAALTGCDNPTQYTKYPLFNGIHMGKLYEAYRHLLDSSYSTVLHGDIKGGNVLIEDGEIKSIIDFGDAVAGAPELDLAWFYLNTKDPRVWEAFLEGYGHSNYNVMKWKFYVFIHGTWLITADFMPKDTHRFDKFIKAVEELSQQMQYWFLFQVM
eukprot:TRINITY_DN135036_c0_g1_i1.p1 TRINITY_DN135036_c0_g1~~TRINITY_DN135036_c0_g1_i1.p1  ORF type:complete len:321 (-),score=23.13 TRINITY_DN135036_c0_g1_i1:41-913(-)